MPTDGPFKKCRHVGSGGVSPHVIRGIARWVSLFLCVLAIPLVPTCRVVPTGSVRLSLVVGL